MGTVSKISCIELSDVQESSSRRVPILRRCLKFLRLAAYSRNYSHIPPMLKFVRRANSLDDWLVTSSSIILPELNSLYCTILAEADPSTQQSPGKFNVAISSRVKQDKDAMRALCSVFEVCVGFCDLADDDNQQHLGIFLRSSAAVLFGSDFQKKRDTLNETDYAMDELARYSSYALCNIMLTYPAVLPMAESILGKRIRSLFKFLHSSPELGINRSLILMLRSLYQTYDEREQGDSNKCRSLIANEFSCTRSGRQSVLDLFQDIDLASEEADTVAQDISLRMYSVGKEDMCFKSANCSIQVKERSGNSRRRVPFRCASIDWNRNSFAIHIAGELPEYWPFFLVSGLEWKKRRKELHLQLETRSGKEAFGIVIRFRSDSVPESKKVTIEDRLRRNMEQVKSQALHKTNKHGSKIRKISRGTVRGEDRRDESGVCAEFDPDVRHLNKERQIKGGSQLSTRVKGKHIFAENPPHKVYSRDSHWEEDSEFFGQSSLVGSEAGQHFNTKSHGTESNYNRSPHSSSICEAGDYRQIGGAADRGGISKLLPVEESVENDSSSGSGRMGASKGAKEMSSRECKPYEREDADGKSSKGRQLEPSLVAVPSSCGNDFLKTSQSSLARRNSQHCRPFANRSVQNICIDHVTEVPVEDGDACFETKGKLKELTLQDEQLRQKLQSFVTNMLQWKQKQTSQILHDSKISITSMRDLFVKQDQGIVTNFAIGVRKCSSLHAGKLSSIASRTKGVLLKNRKRVSSLREKLIEGQQQLKVLKTQSSTDIARARDLMRKEREGLSTSLNQCIANTRRRSESRAKKNSLLQSLARLLKEG